MTIKELIVKNKESFQLGYGLLLIILIPILITVNVNSVIEKYSNNIDKSLQKQLLTVGRSVYALVRDDLSDQAELQKKIDALSKRNSEFQSIEVLTPEALTQEGSDSNESFKVTASLNRAEVGKVIDLYYYNLAWGLKDNDGLATSSFQVLATKDGEALVGDLSRNERFWILAMPMSDASGKKQALLTFKTSSKIIDDLESENRNSAMFWLIITVITTITFLSINIRLWDYALLYNKIKEVDQMKDEFISMASHELRTPLSSIKGYVSLVLEGTFGKIANPEMERSLIRVMASTKRLEELVEDLLSVSRIEQGRLDVELSDVKIEPIVEEINGQLKISADAKNLALIYQRPPQELPPIQCDPERLKQVLVNLVGNSIKYTEKGSVTVSTEMNKDNKLEIRVKDTGIGMSAEEQKRLFEKFYRIKNENTEKIVGTGLGLWITKQIVELMNGKIYIESMKGAGTQFTVVLDPAKSRSSGK
ncbi:MAG: HAMP domain-containing sensor histidine kinase [Candidatus Paceibacterota bacterium]|jgi:signal transduction histidine kinase